MLQIAGPFDDSLIGRGVQFQVSSLAGKAHLRHFFLAAKYPNNPSLTDYFFLLMHSPFGIGLANKSSLCSGK